MFLRAHAISYVSLAADPNPSILMPNVDVVGIGPQMAIFLQKLPCTFTSIIRNTGIAATELQPRTFGEEINDLRPAAAGLSDENEMALK